MREAVPLPVSLILLLLVITHIPGNIFAVGVELKTLR